MVLKLTVLHVLDERQVKLGYVVFVHVEQNITDHHDAFLDFLPHTVELSKELLVMCETNILGNRLQELNCCFFDALIEHLTMLMENKIVRRAVQFFVAKRASLLIVDLVDGILDRLPVLLSLGTLHVGIAHLVAINQKLVSR